MIISKSSWLLWLGYIPGLQSSWCSSIRTSFWIGLSKVVVAVATFTDRTCPFASWCMSTTRAMSHWFLGTLSSAIGIRSPVWRFLLGLFHLTLYCRVWMYSFLHLDQKTLDKYWTRFHLRRRWASAFWKLPGCGITTFDFIVNSWLGVKGSKSLGSLDGTVSGRLLMMHSTSADKDPRDSSSREWSYSHISADRMDRTDRIWRSQRPPIWDAAVFFFHLITQSELSLLRRLWMSWRSVSSRAFLISRTGPLFAMNLRSAFMKESVSSKSAVSMYSSTG